MNSVHPSVVEAWESPSSSSATTTTAAAGIARVRYGLRLNPNCVESVNLPAPYFRVGFDLIAEKRFHSNGLAAITRNRETVVPT